MESFCNEDKERKNNYNYSAGISKVFGMNRLIIKSL